MAATTYPDNLESDVVLRDGSTVSLRPVRPEDAPVLRQFFDSLGERSLAFRFFTGAPNVRESARILAEVDYRERFGLIAFRGTDPRPVGHGFFGRFDVSKAEVAFAVADDLQGHGLGSILLAQLAERAAEVGVATLVAEVLPENHAMVGMFRASGFPVEVHSEPEAVIVEMPTSLSPDAVARFEERDALAARAAVGALLDPDSVELIDGPAGAVPRRLREAAAGGARAIVVRARLDPDAGRELLASCRGAGIRMVGPGSFGILDTRPEAPLNLTTSPTPTQGGVGIVTQGSEVGGELLRLAAERGLGVSSFVSLGARADLTANDLLDYWEEDEATEVALLQVESFSDPHRFARVARRVGRRKPIVVATAGRADEPPARGLFEQVGVIHADGPAEMIDLAAALSGRPLPPGSDARRIHAKVAAYAERPHREPAPAIPPDARRDEAAAILASALQATTAALDPESVLALLRCYGIDLDPSADRGRARARLRVGISADPLFGPILTCAPAGGPADADEARICPLDEGDAGTILGSRSLRGATANLPERGQLERTLEALAAAADNHAEIAALELDPLLVLPGGRVIAGAARVTVRRPPRRHPWPRTWD